MPLAEVDKTDCKLFAPCANKCKCNNYECGKNNSVCSKKIKKRT